MRTIPCAAAPGLALVEAAPAAHAQPPLSIAYRCVKQIGEATGHWPAWTKCIARHLRGWDAKVQQSCAECWKPIRAERLREGTSA